MTTNKQRRLDKMASDLERQFAEDARVEAHPCPGADATTVDETDAFMDDEDGARRLWDDGFRPLHAHQLRHGHVVAWVETDPFLGNPTPVRGSTNVEDVAVDEYEVRVSTWDRGVMTCDECDEVWVKESTL